MKIGTHDFVEIYEPISSPSFNAECQYYRCIRCNLLIYKSKIYFPGKYVTSLAESPAPVSPDRISCAKQEKKFRLQSIKDIIE